VPEACREQIVLAVQAKLTAIASVAGLTVDRDREDDVTEAELPILILREGDERPQADFTAEDAYTLVVQVEGAAKGTTVDAAASAAATLRGKAQAVLFDGTLLGGLARDIRPASEPLPPILMLPAQGPAKAFDLSFEIDYATREGDPFAFA